MLGEKGAKTIENMRLVKIGLIHAQKWRTHETTPKIVDKTFTVHGLVKSQEMSLISFQSELVTAVLSPQVPWQSSLQTFENGLQL